LIRRIQEHDFEQVIRLFTQLWPDMPLSYDDVKSVYNEYNRNDNYQMWCYDDDGIIGIVTITRRQAFYYGGPVAILEDIVIDEQHRGRGIGRQLVEYVEGELAKEGIQCFEVSSDFHREGAHVFWEKMGYKRSGYHFRKRPNSG